MRLVDLSISQRIFGGIAVLMVLFIALGGVSVSGLGSSETRIRGLVLTSQAASDFAELRNMAGQVETAVQTAIRSSQVKDIDAARAGLEKLSRTIDGILAGSITGADGTAVSDALRAVNTEFSRTIATIERRRLALDKIVTQGVSHGTTVDALDIQARAAGDESFTAAAARLRTAIDNGRFLNLRFALTGAPADGALAQDEAGKAAATYEELAAMTPPTPRTKRFLGALEEEVKALPATTADLVAATAERNAAAASLGTALAGLRAAAEAATATLNGQRTAVIDETLSSQRMLKTLIIVVTIGLTVVAGFMGWAGGRSITSAIDGMTSVMRRLANDDLAAEVPALNRSDEIGQMARAVQVFKDNAVAMGRLRSQQTETERRAAEERRSAMGALAHDFQSHVSGIVDLVGSAAREMGETSRAMASASHNATTQVASAATAVDKAADNVKTVAAATEDLRAAVEDIRHHVTQANVTAEQAAKRAVMTDAIVSGLADAAQRIGEIVSMITGIAGQTNMLALNATIEAARAGEAGKGFAVVAGEVKTLANQTAHATSEISNQVSAIQDVTSQAVEAIRAISATIGEISEVSSVIAGAVERQQNATHAIAHSAELAAAGTAEVQANINQVTQVVAAAGKAAAQVLRDTEVLSQTSTELSVQTDDFVARIRAA